MFDVLTGIVDYVNSVYWAIFVSRASLDSDSWSPRIGVGLRASSLTGLICRNSKRGRHCRSRTYAQGLMVDETEDYKSLFDVRQECSERSDLKPCNDPLFTA